MHIFSFEKIQAKTANRNQSIQSSFF